MRLAFGNWDWIEETYGSDTVDDYYMNGYGVEGLVKAVRLMKGMEVEPEGIDYDSEGDTCYIHFTNLAEAIATAELAVEMLRNKSRLSEAIAVARENGFEDS